MEYKLKNVVHENKTHWVLRVKHGYEVYEKGVVCSVRCGIIGYTGAYGLKRAIQRANAN